MKTYKSIMSNKALRVDMLDEDKPIAQQKFVCVSFVSPEKVIASKEIFLFDKFVAGWDLTKSMEKYAQFTAFLAYKYHLDPAMVTEDLTEFCKEEGSILNRGSTSDDYKSFLDKREEELELQYNAANEFQTSVRGIKIRGVYASLPEAELRAKLLREVDPTFDVYVGPVGLWMPWEPDAYKTGRVEFLEEELNELMTKKRANEDDAKDLFAARVREKKETAIRDNIKKAQDTGNKLSQTINSNGDLIGVRNANTQEMTMDELVTPESVRKTLFEGDNIITKITDHGLSALNLP